MRQRKKEYIRHLTLLVLFVPWCATVTSSAISHTLKNEHYIVEAADGPELQVIRGETYYQGMR